MPLGRPLCQDISIQSRWLHKSVPNYNRHLQSVHLSPTGSTLQCHTFELKQPNTDDPERLLENRIKVQLLIFSSLMRIGEKLLCDPRYSSSFPKPNVCFRDHRWGLFSLQKCVASLHAETPEPLELWEMSVGPGLYVHCVLLFLLLFTVSVQQCQQPVSPNHVTRSVHRQAACKGLCKDM